MPAISHPTPEFVRDLKEVFAKHSWTGEPIGVASDNCPEGTTPQTVTYQTPSGDTITKVICV